MNLPILAGPRLILRRLAHDDDRDLLHSRRYFFNSEVQDSVILGLLARDWRSGPHHRSG